MQNEQTMAIVGYMCQDALALKAFITQSKFSGVHMYGERGLKSHYTFAKK